MSKLPLLIFEGPIPDCKEKQTITNELIELHKKKEKDLYSFKVRFQNTFFDKLFIEIETICNILFKKTKLSYNKEMWCYCSNINDFVSKWHNHENMCSYSFVYYFNVPDSEGGEILFEHENSIFSYKPKCGNILCFPKYINHRPCPSNSNEYRISLNIEIKSYEK